MRIGLLGGLRVEHAGSPVAVSGTMQLAVLFRLAIDAGSAVSYRAIAEDVWGTDIPENPRAALQSIVSRLRLQLPADSIESSVGGYRLALARADVDALVFEDTVAAAVAASDPDDARRLASSALALWTGEPWVPSAGFDWFERDLRRDRSTALGLGGVAAATVGTSRIPAPLTAIVGREVELELIEDQLAASRLVTVIGTGGAGKTRLAIEAASQMRGALLVELASVGSDELYAAVLASIGRELRTAEPESTTTRDRVLEALTGRSVLLVLDNCEHLIDEVARLVEDLLGALRDLRVLATSREPLGVPGEAFVPLGPLAHPSERDLGTAQLLSFASVEMFRERAIAARGEDLDAEELVIAARICARLDGLPLALELAAARLRTMRPAEILAGLDHRFTLLAGGFRTALPRHQTLRAMIDWSWSLLSESERIALAWSAVYPAGIDASDAPRVAVSMGLPASAHPFDSLVDRSLLQRVRGRYRALETIREYGIERLAEQGTVEHARQAQLAQVASRALEMDGVIRGPRIHEAIAWFDAEEDNIAAALRCATRAPMPALAIDLVLACAWYWTIRDREDDVRTWFSAILPFASDVDSDVARIVVLLAPIAEAFMGAADEDQDVTTTRALDLIAGMSDIRVPPGAHDLLQVLPPLLTAFAAAGRDPGWMLSVTPPTGEELGLGPWPTALFHVLRAALAQNRGDIVELGIESELAVEQFGRVGDLWGLSLAQQMRAEWLTLYGRLDEAFAFTEKSTANLRAITPRWDLAQQQALAITIMMRQGEIAAARTRVATLLAESQESGDARAIIQIQVTALGLSLHERDIAASIAYLARFDEFGASMPHLPAQTSAMIEACRAYLAALRGDWLGARTALRTSVERAISSHDHPVISYVALQLGMVALERGDISEALRAVDLATVIAGIDDTTAVQAVQIRMAARNAGIGRADASAPTRPMAVEALRGLIA